MDKSPKHTDHKIYRQILLEKTTLLYRDNIHSMLWSLMLGTVFALVVASTVPWHLAARWWLLLLIVIILRVFWSLYVLQNRRVKLENYKKLHLIFSLLSLAYSLVWGVGVWFFVHQQSTEIAMMGMMFLVSLCMGAMPFLFYSLRSVLLFFISTLAPMLAWLLASHKSVLALTALASIIAIVMSYLVAYKLNMFMSRTMRLRIANAKLNNELLEANKALEKTSATDPLTHIGNRRAFDIEFNKTHGALYRDDACMSLLMIDVDYFKRVNDSFGHLVGDSVLVAIASTIQNHLKRPIDMVARYGGEEFVVMLPATDVQGAKRVAEAIRQGVADTPLDHLINAPLKMTISIGIACLRAREVESADVYLSCADKALYEAKESGRNCVRVYSKAVNQITAFAN